MSADDQIVDILDRFLRAYPEDVFPTPPPEQQAKDAAAAHVMRRLALPTMQQARDAIEARDAEIAALAGRLAALESVLRGLSCNVIHSEVDGPFLHVRRETGMLLTDHQADAVRRALTTEGDTPPEEQP